MISKAFFGEGKNIEFKREIPQKHENLLKDIIAFSNSSGGQVIIGIEDKTGAVWGIGDASPFRLSDNISNMIDDTCVPQIESDISSMTVDGKTIIVIDISPGRQRPYYMRSLGKEKSTYIRINGTSRLADERKIKELELEGENRSYDSLRDIGNVYDEEKALNLCTEMKRIALEACDSEEERLAVKDINIEKLLDFGLLCKEGKTLHPTNAFALLSENNRNKAAKIQCALFKGQDRSSFIDRKEFDGPLYDQVKEAYNFVLRHISLGAEIDGMYRNDVYELPVTAIREMIANAVVHRSYLDASCIQVSIFDDRLEVLSPGMLYGGLDIETVKLGKSKCRNGVLAEAFHYMHIIEQWGTGLPRIISKSKEYGLPDPLFEELGDGFRVTIFRKSIIPAQPVNNVFDDYSKLLAVRNLKEKHIAAIKQVFEAGHSSECFSQGDVQEWLQCTKYMSNKIMDIMKVAKIIEKAIGFGPGRYRFVNMKN